MTVYHGDQPLLGGLDLDSVTIIKNNATGTDTRPGDCWIEVADDAPHYVSFGHPTSTRAAPFSIRDPVTTNNTAEGHQSSDEDQKEDTTLY
ncbi:UNVERIFIED_CONTAM: hypothetical protein Slati_1762600 [Sesamum latifolium]|uniref:Uncharacterized protein n=1 Tax=Sesamum latifolium TaxID=2727402 RepID=A0AAW2WX38_9LAMI